MVALLENGIDIVKFSAADKEFELLWISTWNASLCPYWRYPNPTDFNKSFKQCS
jgi:hypothetical protein